MKYGFELEAFVLREEEGATHPALRHPTGPPDNVTEVRRVPVLVPDTLPFDECGWLAEVRSEPHRDITKAIYLLQAETKEVERLAKKAGVTLSYVPLLEIPRDLKVKAARAHGKGLIRFRNLYGHETHRNSTKLQTASLHVSVTEEKVYSYTRAITTAATGCYSAPHQFIYPGFVDHAKLIVGLDKAFAAEIKAAKRNPGFYEVKADGRIEYRSLPNNVDLGKLEDVLRRLKL